MSNILIGIGALTLLIVALFIFSAIFSALFWLHEEMIDWVWGKLDSLKAKITGRLP